MHTSVRVAWHCTVRFAVVCSAAAGEMQPDPCKQDGSTPHALDAPPQPNDIAASTAARNVESCVRRICVFGPCQRRSCTSEPCLAAVACVAATSRSQHVGGIATACVASEPCACVARCCVPLCPRAVLNTRDEERGLQRPRSERGGADVG